MLKGNILYFCWEKQSSLSISPHIPFLKRSMLNSGLVRLTLWSTTGVRGHFPMLSKKVIMKETHRVERRKHIRIGPVVSKRQPDPNLPFSDWSVSELWSKRDPETHSIPSIQEMSVPRCPSATTSCQSDLKQRPTHSCSLLRTSAKMHHRWAYFFSYVSFWHFPFTKMV